MGIAQSLDVEVAEVGEFFAWLGGIRGGPGSQQPRQQRQCKQAAHHGVTETEILPSSTFTW